IRRPMADQIPNSSSLWLVRRPEIGVMTAGSDRECRLHDLWEGKTGWRGWIATVDHKRIGLRYIVTAFLFLIIGGVEALIMRIQLAQPNARMLTPEQFNQLFSMHGITMI